MPYGPAHTLLVSCGIVTMVSTSALAQTTTDTGSGRDAMEGKLEEVVVSARKRDETLLAVPVVVNVVSGADLERHAVTGLDGVARLVPGLTVAENGSAGQGGTVALRGISGPNTNAFGDQAVSFDIDGFVLAKSSVRKLASFDLAQVQVLKGPQALYFGKNSPGGVVSMKTADPTGDFEAGTSVGYEFKAHQVITEGYLSGPVTDTLGGRLAVYATDMRGWVRNSTTTETSPYPPAYAWGPRNSEYDVRGTLKWQPTDALSARFKFTYGEFEGAGPAYNFQYIDCPLGRPQLGGSSSCRPGSVVQHQDVGAQLAQYNPDFGNGVTRADAKQALSSLELNYDITPSLRLTSITGGYDYKHFNVDQFDPEGDASLPSAGRFTHREVSQEIRLNSSFESPLNFAAGAIYSDSRSTNYAHTLLQASGGLVPVFGPGLLDVNHYHFTQKGKAASVFAQALWKIIPELELAAGGRYSHESKRLPYVTQSAGFGPPGLPETRITPLTSSVSFDDFSPEVTLNYRPTTALTVFGSYKEGFLSGGFNANAQSPTLALNYGPQNIKGFEGGVKTELLDRTLSVNFAAYHYEITGLQVINYINTDSVLLNAGEVTIKGVDLDFTWITPLRNLTLQGAVEFNHARYDDYSAQCYGGQTQAEGCNFGDSVGGLYSQQNLNGAPLANAPDWAANLGYTYEMSIGGDLMLGFSNDFQHSSSYFSDAKNDPAGEVSSYTLVNANLRLFQEDNRWQIALIGVNLTDKYYWSSSQDVPFTGGPTGAITSVKADKFAVPSRGREVLLKFDFKFQ